MRISSLLLLLDEVVDRAENDLCTKWHWESIDARRNARKGDRLAPKTVCSLKRVVNSVVEL